MLPVAQVFLSVLPDGKSMLASVYTFAEAGDEIPLHTHDHWHNCQVLAGGVRIYDGNGKELFLKAGELAGLGAGKPHAIQATQAGTLIININEPR